VEDQTINVKFKIVNNAGRDIIVDEVEVAERNPNDPDFSCATSPTDCGEPSYPTIQGTLVQ
jgi:hypothetical protein